MLRNRFFGSAESASKSRFNLLQKFSLISLSGFILTIGLLSIFYRKQAVHDLVVSTEDNNVALASFFSHTLWPVHGAFLSSTQTLTDEELTQSDTVRLLNEKVLEQANGLPIIKLKIFDLTGRTVFSTNLEQIGENKSKTSGFLSARSGQVISQLGHRDIFQGLQRPLKDRDLISTYAPIYIENQGSEVLGVIEIYSDVTPLVQRIHKTQHTVILGSLLILATLYCILVLFVQRAEQIISKQYQQVQDSEERYRHQTKELEEALDHLQKAQIHMLQSEKMSSLGQMVAGIAHEINNPVNFIHGNLEHVENYTYDLIELLQLYEEYYPDPDTKIKTQIAELEINFLKKDLGKTLNSMAVGTKRIREIVLSLRNFSRMDESECKAVDIHEGLESTLMILQHRLKAQGQRPAIKIVRAFSNLPPVDCYPGQLNQVFMNILSNSIDALETQSSQYPQLTPQITLRTETHSESVVIRIADNGIGIPPDVKDRIFDPFFTTKAVGQGTGMGMAISYQLITEKHQGKLRCISTEGIGTEFMIEIPIHLANSKHSTQAKLASKPRYRSI